MDLRQLRYFLQIAETGSFSRAAATLHVAQPSLSAHVQRLEEEFDAKLLRRHPHGVTPTELGLVLCDHARVILREVELAREVIRSSAHSPSGKIMVGLPTSACRGLSIPLTKAIADSYPNISIHLVEAMSGNLDEWIQAGRLDLALLYNHRAFENIAATDTTAPVTMIEDLMLIVSTAHALADRSHIPLSELTQLPIAMPSRPHVIRGVIETAASQANMHLNAVLDCDSLPAIIQLIRHGYAGIFPAFGVAEEIERGEFIPIQIINPIPSWRISVVQSKLTTQMRATDAVAKIMNHVVHNLVDRGIWLARSSSPDPSEPQSDAAKLQSAPRSFASSA